MWSADRTSSAIMSRAAICVKNPALANGAGAGRHGGNLIGADHFQPIRGTHRVPDAVLSGKQKWLQTPFATKVAYGKGIQMHVWTTSAGSQL